jgi:hypothetical protein
MEKYTKELPNKNESTIEWNYPEEMPELSDDQIKNIKDSLDPFIIERTRAEMIFKQVFIDPVLIVSKKFSVLKKINTAIEAKIQNGHFPSDVVMLMLYEDSVKYCAVSLNETIKKLTHFIDKDLKVKYASLLCRVGLESIVEKMSENNPTKAERYKNRLKDYQKLWDEFFPNGTDDKNRPKEDCFEELKNKLGAICQKLRAYRNKVAVHFDDDLAKKGTLPTLLWSDFESIILQMQEFFQGLYFLLTHANIQCDELDGIGFTNEENTVKSYINGIFQSYEC